MGYRKLSGRISCLTLFALIGQVMLGNLVGFTAFAQTTSQDVNDSSEVPGFFSDLKDVFSNAAAKEDIQYVVQDAYTDVANLGNGQYRYRIYDHQRMVYEAASGKEVRPAGWNLFSVVEKSKLADAKDTYTYEVPTSKVEGIKVLAGDYQVNGKTQALPAVSEKKTYKEAKGIDVSELQGLYQDVDVRFFDMKQHRYKEYVFSQVPDGVGKGDVVTLWESVSVPKGVTVYYGEGKKLSEGETEMYQERITFDLGDGEIFEISPAIVFDGGDGDISAKSLGQKVRFDGQTLEIGVEIDADYLLDEKRIYPVTVDPVYSVCEGTVNDRSCVDDLYLRYLTSSNYTNSDLFIGFHDANDGPATRQPLMKFPGLDAALPDDMNVSSATLNLTYSRLGLGAEAVDIPTQAYKVTTPWTYSSVDYGDVRNNLSSVGGPVNIDYDSNSGDVYSWDVTSAVEDWYDGEANNGILIEETPRWTTGPTPNWPDRLFIFESSRDPGGDGPYLEVEMTSNDQSDIGIESYTINSTTVEPGDDLEVEVVVKNFGSVSAGRPTDTHFYFKEGTPRLYNYANYGIASDAVPNLAPGGSYTLNVDYTISNNADPGTYYLYFRADAFRVTDDATLTNNDRYFEITVVEPGQDDPDFIVWNESVSPVQVDIGDSINVTSDVVNSGGDVGPSRLGYYISENRTLSQDDTFLGYSDVPALDEDESAQIQRSFDLPDDRGGYQYVLFIADYEDLIEESSEGNNKADDRVIINTPDLWASIATLSSNTVEAGSTLTLRDRIANQGDTAAGSSVVAYYLSTDTSFNAQEDVFLGSRNTNALGIGQYHDHHNVSVTIPQGTLERSYFILFVADVDNDVLEGDNEQNNVRPISLNVVNDARPNLEANALSLPDTGVHYNGERIDLRFRLDNVGGPDANNFTYHMRMIEPDLNYAYNLRNVSPTPLSAPGNSATFMTVSAEIPEGILPEGNYKISIDLDYGERIAESDETDNYKETTTRVPIHRYNFGNGGGNDPLPDTDNDGYYDVEEKTGGTNINGGQNAPLDDSNYGDYSRRDTDEQAGNFGGDPVNLRTGAFEFTQYDLEIPGRGLPIEFVRTYNSRTTEKNLRSGNGWNHSYNIYYYQDPGTKDVQVYMGGAMVARFTTPDNGQTFVPPKGEYDELYIEDDNIVYRTLEGLKYVFSLDVTDNMGMLESLVDTNGNTTSLTYNIVRDVPLLAEVSDPSGRSLNFVYGEIDDAVKWDKVVRIYDDLAEQLRYVDYIYDDDGNLRSVGMNRFYGEQEEVIYQNYIYDDNNLLVEYVDQRSTRLYNEYDGVGRVLRQYEQNPRIDEPGERREIFTFDYQDGAYPNALGSVTCTVLTTRFSESNTDAERTCFDADGLKVYYENGEGDYETWQHLSSGMVSQHTDMRGYDTAFEYDARRRVTKVTQPDTADWHTETTFGYEDNFNRKTSETELAYPVGDPGSSLSRTMTYAINSANGNLLSMSDYAGRSEVYRYDGHGNMTEKLDRNGNRTFYEYGADGNYLTAEEITVELADGSDQLVRVEYQYDVFGNMVHNVNARDEVFTYEYDSAGNLRKQTDPDNGVVNYQYDYEDNMVRAEDKLGRVTSYVYDTDINNTLISVTRESDAGDIVLNYENDYQGRKTRERDGNDNLTRYGYDDAGRVDFVSTPVNTMNYQFDAAGNMTQEENSLDQVIEYVYDQRGRQVEEKRYLDPQNYVSNRAVYDRFGRVGTTYDGNSNQTNFIYDLDDRLVRKEEPEGRTTVYEYDGNGNMVASLSPRAFGDVSLRNANGDSMTMEYDGLDRLIRQTNAEDKVSLFFHDAAGNLVRQIDRQNANGTDNDHETLYEYDSLQRLTKMTDAESGETIYTYDLEGNKSSERDPAGRTWTYRYDDFDRMVASVDPDTNETTYTYDDNGNLLTVLDANNHQMSFTYDPVNRRTRETDHNGDATILTYDAMGNVTNRRDKKARNTVFVYDDLNRLVSEAHPGSRDVTYTYDANGNRLAVNVEGVTTSFEYDGLDRIDRIVNPGNKNETITFDVEGNVTSKTDGNGTVVSYEYDALNRMTRKDLPTDGDTTFVYDKWGNVVTMTDQIGTVNYTYDNMNRMVNEARGISELDPGVYNIARTYNVAGDLTSLNDGAGRAFTYAYDSRGYLDSVTYDGETLADYTYDLIGEMTRVEYANGVYESYAYDELNRRVNHEVRNAGNDLLFKNQYQYDAEHNRTQMIEGDNERTVNYYYDGLDQLTRVDYSNITGTDDLTFAYDARGNRTSYSNAFDTVTYVYPGVSDEMLAYDTGTRNYGHVYDRNGHVTAVNELREGKAVANITYEYDDLARLEEIRFATAGRPDFMPALSDNVMTFAYDNMGNRMKKTVNGVDSYYINSGLSVLNEVGADGAVTKSIVSGVGQIAEIDAQGAISYVHSDVLGSAVLMTDEGGNVIQRYEYDPFGALMAKAGGAVETSYLFTGQEYDMESELYYYNARYYNPEIGRFLQRDTVIGQDGDVLSRNRYIYTKNNPFKYTDPTGNEPHDVTADFLKRMKDSGAHMNGYDNFLHNNLGLHRRNWVDMFDVSAYVALQINMQHLTPTEIARTPLAVVRELEKRPLAFWEFYSKVKYGGEWDLKSNYPSFGSGFVTFEEMWNNPKVLKKKTHQERADLINTFYFSEPHGYHKMGDLRFGDSVVANDVPGNVMYGYAGAAAGFSELTLKVLAGLANKNQAIANGVDPREYNLGWDTYFDDPRDVKMIDEGINLWRRYGLNLTSGGVTDAMSRLTENRLPSVTSPFGGKGATGDFNYTPGLPKGFTGDFSTPTKNSTPRGATISW